MGYLRSKSGSAYCRLWAGVSARNHSQFPDRVRVALVRELLGGREVVRETFDEEGEKEGFHGPAGDFLPGELHDAINTIAFATPPADQVYRFVG